MRRTTERATSSSPSHALRGAASIKKRHRKKNISIHTHTYTIFVYICSPPPLSLTNRRRNQNKQQKFTSAGRGVASTLPHRLLCFRNRRQTAIEQNTNLQARPSSQLYAHGQPPDRGFPPRNETLFACHRPENKINKSQSLSAMVYDALPRLKARQRI